MLGTSEWIPPHFTSSERVLVLASQKPYSKNPALTKEPQGKARPNKAPRIQVVLLGFQLCPSKVWLAASASGQDSCWTCKWLASSDLEGQAVSFLVVLLRLEHDWGGCSPPTLTCLWHISGHL